MQDLHPAMCTGTRVLLLTVLIATSWQTINAQFAQAVLSAGFWNQPITQDTVAAATAAAARFTPGAVRGAPTTLNALSTGSNLANAFTTPFQSALGTVSDTVTAVTPRFFQSGVRLPACPTSNVLATDGGVPEDWNEMSALEQATHPVNALMIQLAYAVWKDNPAQEMGKCLSAMGIDVPSIQVINVKVKPYGGTMTALVMRAGSKAVFVSLRGTDFMDAGDILIDGDCHYTPNVKDAFGGQGDIRMHNGFYTAWQALEKDVAAAITSQLAKVTGPKRVYFVGHSLGASLAAIASLRMNHLWRDTGREVAGVWLFGCPRVGNIGWRNEYNKQLLQKTLRFSNFADFAARLPMQTQVCPLTHLNGTFTFNHIGQSLVLCPNRATGLVNWVLSPQGSEQLDCGATPDIPDLTVKTHWLGSYLDAWRRGVAGATGKDQADTIQIRNTICAECYKFFLDQNKQVNMIARAGGPVMCTTTASCNRRDAWDAATSVDGTSTKSFSPLSVCLGYLCTL